MIDPPTRRAAARAHHLAELEQVLRTARAEAARLSNERPGSAEIALLIDQIDRLCTELEEIRRGGFKPARPASANRGAQPPWRPKAPR